MTCMLQFNVIEDNSNYMYLMVNHGTVKPTHVVTSICLSFFDLQIQFTHCVSSTSFLSSRVY